MSKATREARTEEIKSLQKGIGLFVLLNRTASDLILPKLSLDTPPKRQIGPGGRFLGDSYHLDNMRDLVVVDQVIHDGSTPPEPASAPVPNNEEKVQAVAKPKPPPIANLDVAGMLSEDS